MKQHRQTAAGEYDDGADNRTAAASGRGAAEGIYGAVRHHGEQAGFDPACHGAAHHRNHDRQARHITADTALRLAKCLNTSAEYWLTLQMQYDLAAVQKAIGERLEREIRPISLKRQEDEPA